MQTLRTNRYDSYIYDAARPSQGAFCCLRLHLFCAQKPLKTYAIPAFISSQINILPALFVSSYKKVIYAYIGVIDFCGYRRSDENHL